MSLDYWRNEERTCTLSDDDGHIHLWIREDDASGDAQVATLNRQDLINLYNSLNLMLCQ